MKCVDEVLFANGPQPIAAVLDRLQLVTGLPLGYDELVIGCAEHDMEVLGANGEKSGELFRHGPTVDYLLGNALFPLTLLGGPCAGRLPEWVGTAWAAATQP